MSDLRQFHRAVTVHDLTQARSFYGGLIDRSGGRSPSRRVDFNFLVTGDSQIFAT
jgi:extradiol dioxygenase family protein